jgi:O-methyltransferase
MDFRAAYLELLKRGLLDLLGHEVYRTKPGNRELPDVLVDRRRRLRGRDWPFNAVTMSGLYRLENVQACVEDVIAKGVPGDLIETGVWRGGTAIFMRALLRAHDVTDRSVWLADSFAGLPAPNPDYPADAGSDAHEQPLLAVPLERVRRNFAKYDLLDDQVKFLEGWFSDTLPTLRDRTWSVVRLDGDLYESTIVALDNLYAGLSPGGYLIVDDYGTVAACRQAVEDFRARHAITEELHDIDGTGVFWQKSRVPAGAREDPAVTADQT